MQTSKIIHTVSCHAEGEVGDVIVGGVAPPPGTTLWEQSRWIARDKTLRNFMLNEPRGGVFRHVNLLVPPKNPEAQMGWIIMEPEDTPPMSGSNSICVATVLLETGILPMEEPETHLVLEAPGGLIRAVASCKNNRVERMTIHNLPSFAHQLSVPLEVPGLGTLTVDTAYGGDSFVIVDSKALGFDVTPDEAREMVAAGIKITNAATEQLGFVHPENPWNHISFCQIAAPLTEENGVILGKNTVIIQPGKLDRSPTGTGCAARMAVLERRGILKPGDRYIGESIIGSRFHCKIEQRTRVAQRWSSLYGKKIKPEDVYCNGCKSGGTQGIYCQTMCRIKPCCREKQIETCAQCQEFACKDLKEVFNFSSDAKKRLLGLKR